MHDLYQPVREHGTLTYDQHVDEIAFVLALAVDLDADLFRRLMKSLREQVRGEMLMEVLEALTARRRG